MSPDGSAVQVHIAARPVTLELMLLLGLLLCPPLSLLGMIGVFAVSTKRVGALRPGARLLCRVFLGASLILALLSTQGLTWALLASGLCALMVWPLFVIHLIALTRPDSPIRQKVLGVGVAVSMTPLPLLLAMALGMTGDTTAILSAVSFILMIVVPFPAMLWVMGQYWAAPDATPEEIILSIQRQCAPLGFTEVPWSEGVWLLGHRGGRRAELQLDFRRAPSQISVVALLPEWPDAARVRVRMEGETGGQPLSDPLLSRLLLVEGLPDADAVLSGLHENLLPILHAWPDSEIAGGQVRVVLTGPPFVTDEIRQTPRWVGVFVLEQLTAAVELANLLGPRLMATGQQPSSLSRSIDDAIQARAPTKQET